MARDRGTHLTSGRAVPVVSAPGIARGRRVVPRIYGCVCKSPDDPSDRARELFVRPRRLMSRCRRSDWNRPTSSSWIGRRGEPTQLRHARPGWGPHDGADVTESAPYSLVTIWHVRGTASRGIALHVPLPVRLAQVPGSTRRAGLRQAAALDVIPFGAASRGRRPAAEAPPRRRRAARSPAEAWQGRVPEFAFALLLPG
jgi:hypothetical protein